MIRNRNEVRAARSALLAIANCYEPKRRKILRGVFYDKSTGSYRWIGEAHDYSVFPSSLKTLR